MSMKDFSIITKLGEGAYSSVYKVQRTKDSQIYALKKVKMGNLSQKEQENALNQVRILASIHSPYIVAYKQAFIQNNCLCIIMQYADDGDLYQKIVVHQKQRTTFDQDDIWKALIQILKGLSALHQLNILHRDLKSANVFMNKEGPAKLGDMNVSKIAKNGLLYTQTGTPYYASPQVWKDKPYDSKSDIWSLGCVIYEMTTLKPPFRAEDMDGLYKKVIKGSYPKIGQNYSKHLAKAIKDMLQVNPANRPSAQGLLKSINFKVRQLELEVQSEQEHKNALIETIRPDRKLHYLTDRLPQSNYQNDHQEDRTSKMSAGNRLKGINSQSYGINKSYSINQKGINLPKLDRIVVKNSANKIPVLYHQNNDLEKSIQKSANNDLLKIDKYSVNQRSINKVNLNSNGSNNNLYNVDLDPAKRVLVRDIKAELRKIYNLKPVPKSPNRRIHRRNIELPKLN